MQHLGARFELAIPIIFEHEGLFVNDPSDPGGATNYGISLRYLKKFENSPKDILALFDIDGNGILDEKDIKQMTKTQAEAIYKRMWWDKFQYGRILNQSIANKVFDLAVNMGSTQAHICAQRAVRSACGLQLIEDGILGSKTIGSINQCDQIALLAAIKSEGAGVYRFLNKSKYIKGWLNRAYS